jgi:hypothetical protein
LLLLLLPLLISKSNCLGCQQSAAAEQRSQRPSWPLTAFEKRLMLCLLILLLPGCSAADPTLDQPIEAAEQLQHSIVSITG